MLARLLLFSDGTGNSSAKAEKTNVWRLFQAVDLSGGTQKAYYDDGVGSSSNKYLAALGGIFGWGLKRNVIDLYKFVCRNYVPGVEISGFGFSRGAFTIRLLVGLIHVEGLVLASSEEELDRKARAAYRAYRSKRFTSYSPIVMLGRWVRDLTLRSYDLIRKRKPYDTRLNRHDIPIAFLGLWDTVEAYEIPIVALKKAVDLALWPMVFCDLSLSTSVRTARHALSLDDARRTFHPLLWDEEAEARMVSERRVPRGRLLQVWFAGVHSNVGGGYPEDRLSLVPLHWMMSEASAAGVQFLPTAIQEIASAKSAYARLYDSRAGLWAFYRFSPRKTPVLKDVTGRHILPIVDGSVVLRMANGDDRYASAALPEAFAVLTPTGNILPICATPTAIAPLPQSIPLLGMTSSQRNDESHRIRVACSKLNTPWKEAIGIVQDTIWWREAVYLLSLLLLVLLLGMPLYSAKLLALSDKLGTNVGSDLIARAVNLAKSFLPNLSSPWTDAFARHPTTFALLAGGLLLSLYLSSRLKTRIGDRVRLAWFPKFRRRYLLWLLRSERGGRRTTAFAAGLLAVISVFSVVWPSAVGASSTHSAWPTLTSVELALATLVLLVVLAWRSYRLVILAKVRQTPAGSALPKSFALTLAQKLRENDPLAHWYKVLTDKIVPSLLVLAFLGGMLQAASSLLFDVGNSLGTHCPRVDNDAPRNAGEFSTADLCWPTQVLVAEGARYRITLRTEGNWFDASLRSDVGGLGPSTLLHASLPLLKRRWQPDWFQPVARIGEAGSDEYVLEPVQPFARHVYPNKRAIEPQEKHSVRISNEEAGRLMKEEPTPADRQTLISEFTARNTGCLYLYVNDAVLPWPLDATYFYRNNRGTAQVSVERLMPDGTVQTLVPGMQTEAGQCREVQRKQAELARR